jgi:hypothetical protein
MEGAKSDLPMSARQVQPHMQATPFVAPQPVPQAAVTPLYRHHDPVTFAPQYPLPPIHSPGSRYDPPLQLQQATCVLPAIQQPPRSLRHYAHEPPTHMRIAHGAAAATIGVVRLPHSEGFQSAVRSLMPQVPHHFESGRVAPDYATSRIQRRYEMWLNRLRAPDNEDSHPAISKLPRQQAEAIQYMELAFTSRHPDPIDRHEREGCILKDCFGFSKMSTVFAFAELVCTGGVSAAKVLIVVPDISIPTWKEQSSMLSTLVAFTLIDAEYMEASDVNGDVSDSLRQWTSGVLLVALSVLTTLIHGSRTEPKAVASALCNPGADFIFFDEAHRLRFLDPRTLGFLRRVRTPCRVALTSAPLYANLYEYWAMTDWVTLSAFGTLDQFSEVFVRRIVEGQRVTYLPVHQPSGSPRLHPLRLESFRAALLLQNRVSRLAIPLSVLPELPVDTFHLKLHVHMDTTQAQCYTACAGVVDGAVREGAMNPSIGALILQMAATHLFALEQFLNRLISFGASRPPDIAPVLACLQNARKALEIVSGKVDAVVSELRVKNQVPYPSSKLLVISCLFQECRKGGDRMVVFAQSEEVLLAMKKGLMFMNPQCATDVFSCSSRESRLGAQQVGAWAACHRGAVMLTMIGPGSDYSEVAGWKFPGTSRVVLVDCCWSMAYAYQALARVIPVQDGPSHPLHVYSLVAAATCERSWDYRHELSATSPREESFDLGTADYLVAGDFSRSALAPPALVSPGASWDFNTKPRTLPKVSQNLINSMITLDSAAKSAIDALRVLRLSSLTDAGYALYEICAPSVCNLARAPQVLTHSFHKASPEDMTEACDECDAATRRYKLALGHTLWNGLEERAYRDDRQSMVDFKDGEARQHMIMSPSESLAAGSSLLPYELIRSYWDLYSRPYMLQPGRGDRNSGPARRLAPTPARDPGQAQLREGTSRQPLTPRTLLTPGRPSTPGLPSPLSRPSTPDRLHSAPQHPQEAETGPIANGTLSELNEDPAETGWGAAVDHR